MKIKDIMELVVSEGISVDPRNEEEINKILSDKKNEYDKLEGVKKEIFDIDSFKSPYADSRIIWDNQKDVNELWVGIDVDTAELMMVRKITDDTDRIPGVISHHPLGRAYSNFYEVMDMQSDILQNLGMAAGIADNLTRRRKAEVGRKLSAVNHFKAQDAARILGIPVMSMHTPADNHVKKHLDDTFMREEPNKLDDVIDVLLEIEEYRIAAKNGNPPSILSGSKENRCGKIFVDMTGGTEGDAEVLKNLGTSGVSTVVAMHMSDKHYKVAKESNLNVVIAGHISSDNLGINLLLDKIISTLGKIDIIEFSGFVRVKR